MKEINCNLCGWNNTKLLFRSRDRRINAQDETLFSLVQCKNCGLVYVNPQPTYEELKPFYGENYFDSSFQYKGRKKEIYNFLKKIKNIFFDNPFYLQDPKFYKRKVLNRKNGKFLDVGCNIGVQRFFKC